MSSRTLLSRAALAFMAILVLSSCSGRDQEGDRTTIIRSAVEAVLGEIPYPPEAFVVHPLYVVTAEDWTPAPSPRPQDFIHTDTAPIREAAEDLGLRICRLEEGSLICVQESDVQEFIVVSEPRVGDGQAQILVVVSAFRSAHTMEYVVTLDRVGDGWGNPTTQVTGGI